MDNRAQLNREIEDATDQLIGLKIEFADKAEAALVMQLIRALTKTANATAGTATSKIIGIGTAKMVEQFQLVWLDSGWELPK